MKTRSLDDSNDKDVLGGIKKIRDLVKSLVDDMADMKKSFDSIVFTVARSLSLLQR